MLVPLKVRVYYSKLNDNIRRVLSLSWAVEERVAQKNIHKINWWLCCQHAIERNGEGNVVPAVLAPQLAIPTMTRDQSRLRARTRPGLQVVAVAHVPQLEVGLAVERGGEGHVVAGAGRGAGPAVGRHARHAVLGLVSSTRPGLQVVAVAHVPQLEVGLAVERGGEGHVVAGAGRGAGPAVGRHARHAVLGLVSSTRPGLQVVAVAHVPQLEVGLAVERGGEGHVVAGAGRGAGPAVGRHARHAVLGLVSSTRPGLQVVAVAYVPQLEVGLAVERGGEGHVVAGAGRGAGPAVGRHARHAVLGLVSSTRPGLQVVAVAYVPQLEVGLAVERGGEGHVVAGAGRGAGPAVGRHARHAVLGLVSR
ncbi:hypothetical protein ACJJTC_006396 [Scirpophaga incertulas]